MIFVRLDKSIDPVELVHRLCAEAQANPDLKKSRYVKRLTPVTEVRKTLSVDVEAFARQILKPVFHSGGPPKTVGGDYVSDPAGIFQLDPTRRLLLHLDRLPWRASKPPPPPPPPPPPHLFFLLGNANLVVSHVVCHSTFSTGKQ